MNVYNRYKTDTTDKLYLLRLHATARAPSRQASREGAAGAAAARVDGADRGTIALAAWGSGLANAAWGSASGDGSVSVSRRST